MITFYFHIYNLYFLFLINIIPKKKQVSNSLEWYLGKNFDIFYLIENMIHRKH